MKNRLTIPSKKVSLITTATAIAFLLCGCQIIPNYEVSRFGTDRKFTDLKYTGDGNFTDYGRKAGIFRFVLDLESIDLKEASVKQFELKGLPEVEFVCYLRVDHPLPTIGRPKDFKAGDLVVEMALEDQDGKKVFSDEVPLSRWIWSGSIGAAKSDLYTRKTIFTPEQGKSYRISTKIAEGNIQAPKARLLLMGGGWKAGD